MTLTICFIIGFLIGSLGTAHGLNRFYRSEIWTARKEIMLEKLLVQRKRAELQRTKAEAEIDEVLRRRTNG
jgi:hypothetical protein